MVVRHFVVCLTLLMLSVPIRGNAAPGSHRSAKIEAELAVGGDDGLTQRFAEAIRSAITNSDDFSLAPRVSTKNVRLTIPSNVYWHPAQKKINFHAVVIFTRGIEFIGSSDSPCWDDQMERCAMSVLRDLRTNIAYRNRKSTSARLPPPH